MTTIIKNKISKISALCRRHKVKQLYLFGSAAEGDFSATSDVDFLISFDGVPLLDYADNFFDLQEELENVLNRKVDLVVEKSITNPYLKSMVEKTRTLIYG